LTLHGVTRPVLAVVKSDSHVYIGTTRIKQTTFGIQPITIGRGIVRVKDELEISFQVYTDASADHTLPYSKAR
jgi:polyisoprenoid-binding protein YceI